MTRKNVAKLGIGLCFLYFIVTFVFIFMGSRTWLTAMELTTMISGVFMLMLIIVLPFSQSNTLQGYKLLSIIFVSSCMILTNVAHMVNLTVTEHLMKSGLSVPSYLQIGKWPSIEMAVDYLAWGLFMGLAFIVSSLGIKNNASSKKLKTTLIICGALCIIGFFGAILINENMWYAAPMGYGIGTVIICIELLHYDHIK